MSMIFQIDSVITLLGRDACFAFARRLSDIPFQFTDNSTLGGVPVVKYLEKPRCIRTDGTPDLSIFAFQLRNTDDKDRLKSGDRDELSESC